MENPLRRSAIYLTLAAFALHPIAFGGWLAQIPLVKETLGLNKAELSLALLGMPIAIIPSLQIAGRLIGRLGPRRVLAVSFPMQIGAVILPLLAVDQVTLFLALMVFGAVTAFSQVCLNVYAGRLEKALGTSVMNRCHGFWALGLMAGPLIATTLAGWSPIVTLLGMSIAATSTGAVIALRLPRLGEVNEGATPPRRKLAAVPPALVAVSLFALAIGMTEGAMADWAAIYLAERLPDDATIAGLGVSVYAAFLAGGRLTGDWMKDRIGAVRLARLTLGLAIVGLALLVLPFPLFTAFFGFALVGAGVSVGFPLGVSAVAALDDTYEGANIAVMSGVAICGFLIGPPVIGFLAEAFSLRVGLAALLPGLILGLWFCRALSPAESADESAIVASRTK